MDICKDIKTRTLFIWENLKKFEKTKWRNLTYEYIQSHCINDKKC
jgi:hypothetical protein